MQNTVLSGTINNAIITLGNIDDSGKGRHFVSRFIKDGLVKIEGHGVVLLKKETLDASLPSMIGTPVIIRHQDVTKKNADKLRCGTIANAYFNEPDGWYYCEGIIWDEDAQELIENQGWSVSCSYDFLSYNDEGGVENNIPYDKEFTQLNFTHLAIVDNPRYERANIVFNSKVNNEDKWITIHPNGEDGKGKHLLLKDGETPKEAIERTYGKKGTQKQDTKGGKSGNQRESNTTKDTRRHIDRIEKLIKKYNLEPHEEDELLDELGSFEAKLDENLEPREEEELREELFDFEDDIKRHQEMKKQEKSEPKWLQREKQKLDRQTTQMYEDRYSTEHPETYKKNLEEAKGKQSDTKDKHGFKKDKDSGYYMKDLSDGTSVYVEKKEGGQGEKEPFYLEATHFDKDGKTIAKKQYHYDSMDGMFSKIDKDFADKDQKSDTKAADRVKKAFDLAKKVHEGGELSQQEKDWLNSNKGAEELKDNQKPPQKITKQMEAEHIIDDFYEEDFISDEYARRMSEALGTQITTDDIWDAMEKSRPNRGSADYDISKMANELLKTAKDKKKKQKEWDKKQAEIKKQDALRYDLKSMLKRHSPYADYRYDEEDNTLEVRYWGDWEGDDGSGDYDWQTPTQKTKDKIEQIKKDFKKQYGYDLQVGTGEKNWMYFNIKEKKNKANNSKEQDMALLEEIKKLISKVENSKENEMEIDEKIENETVDKRKLIDEVAGIMKSAGCDDEVIRTAIGKMEKIGYDKSEAGSADNKKVKNEEPDKKDDKDKKEVKDLKDDLKKDVDNKCKNSKEESSFDKINAIYNSIKLVKEESKYTSRQEKLDAAKEYFS